MKVGIIGSGNIGATLGRLWAAAGHRVCFGSRAPDGLRPLAAAAGSGAFAGTHEEAAAFGDAVLVALPLHAVPDLPADALRGKAVLSCVNQVPWRDGSPDLRGLTQVEWLAFWLPEAHVVKAFNAVPAATLRALPAGGPRGRVAVPVAIDDPGARLAARRLVRAAHCVPLDAGPLRNGRWSEPPDGALCGPLTPERLEARLDRLKVDVDVAGGGGGAPEPAAASRGPSAVEAS